MRPKLVTTVAALSLLFCVLTGGIWIRSYWTRDLWLEYSGDWTCRGIDSWRGEIAYAVWPTGLDTPPDDPFCYGIDGMRARWAIPASVSMSERLSHRTGEQAWLRYLHLTVGDFSRLARGGVPDIPLRVVSFPYWMLCGLFAIGPVGLLASVLRRRRRRNAGSCPSCGYDLRATPDRCPECGHVPEKTIA